MGTSKAFSARSKLPPGGHPEKHLFLPASGLCWDEFSVQSSWLCPELLFFYFIALFSSFFVYFFLSCVDKDDLEFSEIHLPLSVRCWD